MSEQAIQVLTDLRQQIDAQIRPKLDIKDYDGGYDCHGCSTYDQIVDDIVALLDQQIEGLR